MKTETVNYRLLIDLVLEQIINLRVEKRYFYNEEFDPHYLDNSATTVASLAAAKKAFEMMTENYANLFISERTLYRKIKELGIDEY